MEDYLETIFLQDRNGQTAKVKNIADAMGVSKPSVTEALSVLQDRGLVSHQKYGDIELTERGRQTAMRIYSRHKLFFELLRDIFGVSEEIAEDDACKVEHIVSEETAVNLREFLRFVVEQRENNGPYAGFVPEFQKRLQARSTGVR